MDGPIHAALTAQGAILILESNNNRIQAFDIGGNPVPYFANGAYFVPLQRPGGTATYLDLAVEYSGYLYVLSYTRQRAVHVPSGYLHAGRGVAGAHDGGECGLSWR